MPFGRFEVLKIMEWGNLDRAGAEFRVDEGVLNERDVPADERKDQRTPL